MSELQHYGVKGMKWKRTKAAQPENLKGSSLLETKVYQTPQWLRDNGYLMSPTDALNTLKSLLPKRRSSGKDIVNAMKRVNRQGGVSVRKLNARRVNLGKEVISRMMKSK